MPDVSELATNEQVAAKIKQLFETSIPFNKHLGLKLEELSQGHARLELAHRDEFLGDMMKRILHGGVLCSLIDAAGGAAAMSTLHYPRERSVNTIDMRVDFLRPAGGATFTAFADVARKGSRIIFTDIRVDGDDGQTVARGTATYSIFAPSDKSKPAGVATEPPHEGVD